MAPISKVIIASLAILAAPGLCAPMPVPVAAVAVRQLAGEGQALDSVFTDSDNGIGYGSEDALDNAGALVAGAKGGQATTPAQPGGSGGSGGNPPPPPPPGNKKRQANKTGAGLDTFLSDAGAPQEGAIVGDNLNTYDGDGTSGAANAGALVGSTIESSLETAGSSVPS